MPHIKKPFAKTGALCYKCGREIPLGSLNWSYNTHARGLFAHQECYIQSPATPIELALKPSLIQTPKPTPVANTGDITDKIQVAGKHNRVSLIKTVMRERQYAFLYGSPGAGKTHLVDSIAADMELPFLLVSCASDMLKSELVGSKSPVSGVYFETKFRKLWHDGGVILFDECGLAPGAFLNVLNAAMEQRFIDFPDGVQVKMHPNCFLVFADNSSLYGNDQLFPERGDVGGAFRDRLTYISFPYDVDLELRILVSKFDGDTKRATDWHRQVKCLRHELKSLEVPVFASPRFAYKSATWIKAGLPMEEIIRMELLRGVSIDVEKLVIPTIERCLQIRMS